MVSRFFRCLFPVWRSTPSTLPITPPVEESRSRHPTPTNVNMNMLVMSAYERHVARSYMKQRNVFQDRLEKVLPMIHDASLDMKEKHARLLSEVCLRQVRDASLEMKQKRAMRLLSLVFPVMRAVASVKHQHRLSMHEVRVCVHKVAGDKSNQRARLDHLLRVEFPLGIRERERREEMRARFRRTVLSSLVETVYRRRCYAERLHYANLWERVMGGVVAFKRPVKKEKREQEDYLPFMILLVWVGLFWVLLWGMMYCLGSMGYVFMERGRCFWRDMQEKADAFLNRLERRYERNHPPVSRKQRRQEKKMDKKMRSAQSRVLLI